ncbi:hypothetical protein JCM3775_004463 [Rhodotorula graminis]
MSSSSAPFAPVTPTRRTSFAAADKAPLVAPSNPRKRRLPPSPVKPAFSLSPPPPRTRPYLASHTLSLTTSASCSFATTPPAPLLPPAPIFDVLPLPPVTPTSSTSSSTASLRSSPMRRSPAMKDLAAFTRSAYAAAEGGATADEGFERRSVSRLELGGAAYRSGRVDAWAMNDDGVDGSSAAATYSSSSAFSSSPSLALGLGLGLGYSSSRFGEDDLPLRASSHSPSFPSLALSLGAALSPASRPSTPSTPGLSPSSSTSHLSPTSSISSSTTSSWLATSPVPLPFAHLSLSASPLELGDVHLGGSGDGCGASPSSLALRRMDSLERRRRAKGAATPARHERCEAEEERGEPFVGLGLEL